MKKLLILLGVIVTFFTSTAFVIAKNNEGMSALSSTKTNADVIQNVVITKDIMDAPKAYVHNVEYKSDGKIIVEVGVRNMEESKRYRIKVKPVSQIMGLVVEGALYTEVYDYPNMTKKIGQVEFNCYSGKQENAQYCRAYDFTAEIVN